jgi:hypothetical protein
MITLLIQLVIVLLIAGLLWFAVSKIPGLPPWVLVVVQIIAILFVVIWLAATFLGSSSPFGTGPTYRPSHW